MCKTVSDETMFGARVPAAEVGGICTHATACTVTAVKSSDARSPTIPSLGFSTQSFRGYLCFGYLASSDRSTVLNRIVSRRRTCHQADVRREILHTLVPALGVTGLRMRDPLRCTCHPRSTGMIWSSVHIPG